MGPKVGSAYRKSVIYSFTAEMEDLIDGEYQIPPFLQNITLVESVIKSETWLSGKCDSDCPGNCTGGGVRECGSDLGGGKGKCKNLNTQSEWNYVQKSLNPGTNDETIFDPSLRTVCKSNFEILVNNHLKNIIFNVFFLA